MTPEKRIKELQVRQVWNDSSMVVKLHAENGLFYYKVFAWIDNGTYDTKFPVTEGKYNGEDPETLIKDALNYLGLKKIKLGKPIGNGGALLT